MTINKGNILEFLKKVFFGTNTSVFLPIEYVLVVVHIAIVDLP